MDHSQPGDGTVTLTALTPRLGGPARLPLYPTLLLLAMSFAPRVQESQPLVWAFWGSCGVLLTWQWWLGRAIAREGRTLSVEGTRRKTH